MDEMDDPVLAAADGVVVYTHDNEFDRWTWGDDLQNFVNSNIVSILHSGGYVTTYSSLKKHSIMVSEGDTVQAGDTIGYPGSSDPIALKPNLMFAVSMNDNDQFISPWIGECGFDNSMWAEQLP